MRRWRSRAPQYIVDDEVWVKDTYYQMWIRGTIVDQFKGGSVMIRWQPHRRDAISELFGWWALRRRVRPFTDWRAAA